MRGVSILRANKNGFTLLELMVVITLMGLVASAGLAIVNTISEQERTDIPNDLTKSKWAQIRYAIIGDSSLILNNSPMLSGYVADMGRLPVNIEELLSLGMQPAWSRYDINAVNANVPANTVFLWGGWRGPYLHTGGSQFFRDAWLNKSVIAVDDANNHGWVVTHLPETIPACTTELDCTDIQVQSLGNNGVLDAADFPVNPPEPAPPINLVSANEWQLSAPSIGFNVILNKAPLQNQNLVLRLYYIENGVVEEEISTPFNHLTTDDGVTSHFVTINPVAPLTSIILPIGKYAAVITCADDVSPTSGEVVYSGSCDNPQTIPPAIPAYYFTLLPRQTLPINIYWNIP